MTTQTTARTTDELQAEYVAFIKSEGFSRVANRAIDTRTKITADHIDASPKLGVLAERAVEVYFGRSSFMHSVADQHFAGRALTAKQLAAVLNTVVGDFKRIAQEAHEDELATIANSINGDEAQTEPRQNGYATRRFLRPGVTSPVRNGTFTVVMNEERRTLRISDAEWITDSKMQVVSFLSGSDNDTDYTGFAFIDETGAIKIWKKFRGEGSAEIREALAILATWTDEERQAAGKVYALESGRCWVCGRTLTTPGSIEAGIGPICQSKL